MTEEEFQLKPTADASPAANRVIEAPTRAETVKFAINDSPRGESDESMAAKAEYLGRVYFDLLQKAQQGIDPNKDDSMLRAEAVYFTKAMTGQDDVYGKLWQKGGFKTGREYLEKMHSFFLYGGEKNLSPELKAFREKSHEEQVAEAMAKRGELDKIVHSVGSGASYAIDWLHRADTEKLADEKRLHEDIYKEQVRSEYAAKLMADNAWYELSAIMPTLSSDAQACAKALLDSKDNRLPETMWAKFNNLDDSEKGLICRVRTCLMPRVEGSLGNTLGDIGIGAANVAANVAAAPWRFGNKIGMTISNEAFDAGFDVNELARRRQYLYRVTGSFTAGGDLETGYLPQMQFEQMCEEHGFLSESLIGAISTLPYMAAAAVPGIGVATVAMEAMSQMDDHVAMSGGDITDPDYMFSSALFGGLYAYTERLQLEGLLGGVTDMKLREAMLKGFWNGVKDSKTLRTLTAETLAESLQEGLQNGIMSANEALALDQDATKAFVEGFTEDFINSLGTMLVVEGGSLGFAHWKRSGFNNPFTVSGREAGREARSLDLETEYEKNMSLDRMVEYSARSDELRAVMDAAEAYRLLGTWENGGKDALVKAGIDPVRAEEWDYFFSSTRNGVIQDEETGEDMPDLRWQKAQQDIYRYLAHEAAERTKKGEEADLAAFDLAMENLDWVRSAWSQGAGVHRVDEEGKVQDPGAKALEELGFSKDVAARLSEYFHKERASAYSPAALNGIKARYDARMEGKVTAKAALAQQFGGRIVRLDGADYLRFDGADGPSLVRIDETPGGIDFNEASEGVAVDVERATQGEVTKQDWMDATADERRAIWKRYGLVHEGAFKPSAAVKVSLPADPSVGVDSVQAATIVGTISLDSQTDNRTIADTSAAFHEVFHAFSQFAETSGLWTKEDIAFLEKKFGKAKMASERFDEEAGAEGFRSFLARRANGALTVEDERSPFARIYAVAAGLNARAKEMGVKEAEADEAEKAFFHQLIAEANKPKPTPPAPKPNLPSTAAPQKGLKPSSAEATEGKPGTETAETGTGNGESGTPKAETETKFVQMEVPTTWSAYTPTGNVKVSGHWAVLDLKDVVHSNNPLYAVHMRAQLRNRKDNKAEEDTRKDIVNNFQGERLLDAPDTANGAPIVFYDDDGTGVKRAFVLSGNGRVLVLNELAERHLYDRYRNVMKAWAEARGMSVPPGETPILVRVIDDYGGASRDKVADLSNTNAIQQYTEEEQARADAEVIKALGLARLYQANADGTPDMTPGANDEFFSEFVRGVGDTSLYNSDRSLTQTARDRAQRALLAIAVGQGDRGRDVVKKLVEQTETLNIQRQKNAAALMAAPVAALESNAAYAIGPDVSRAMADFMDYAEKRKAGKVGTFGDYFNQMDLIDGPSKIAREILKLLGSDKAAATIAEYVKAYCRVAGMEDAGGNLFGAARTREEIWADAARFVDDTIAKTQGVEPSVAQQTTEKGEAKAETKEPPKRQQGRDAAIPKGEVRLGPATPETARQARPPAGTVTYTINPQKGGPVTSTMPAGAFADLRGPYDPYEKTPEAKNPVRSIFSGTATRQLDPQGRYWGDKMPQFMGHKTEMFDRTVMTLRQKLGPGELAKFDTLVDYFGGGGCWGMALALATMPNVKRIIINEFDPGRAKKIELLQTLGENIAAEAEKMFKESGVMDEVVQRMKTAGDDGGESGSGATLANVIIRNYKERFAKDPRMLGLMYAVTDCASRQLAGSRDVRDPSTGETTKVKISFAERWAKVKEQLAQDGRNATAMRKAIEARGGTVEYVNGDSTKPDLGVGFDVPHGGNVMAVADPPYYRTEGYSDDGSSWKVGLEKIEGGYGYANTGEFLKSLVDNGDGIVYTDEAWWLKPEYMETHRVHSDGLFDDAEILAANPEFRRENQILQGIRDAIDHFDVAGKVAGHYETLGVHHGKETKYGNDEGTGESQGSGVLPVGDVGSTGDGQGGQTDGHHSVRRLAGGAEGEDITLLRDGRGGRPESGSRAEDAVRRIDAAIKDALPPDVAGYPGQAEEIERLARHSVRQVREERMWEYAASVSRNARRWLKDAERRLDERMKAADYTEKVWHGTYGKDFNVFKFSANSHDVPAAYFTYNHGTAQNYAALNGDGDLEEFQDSQYNTRQFYINPGKVLEWDEAEKPTSLEQFIEKMKKAYEDGYNSVIVRNALDDAGARLDEYDNGPMFFLEPGERPGDGEGTYQTDILIVMQQEGDNAPARIKAADPVTFLDEDYGGLPIPLEMRADQTMPDVRYSVQMGKNAREEARRMIWKYHPWRFEGELDEDIFDEGELDKYIDRTVNAIAAFETPKERKAALLWFCKDTIELPEDSPKVTEAIKTAEKAKVDPFQFDRPGEILTRYADYRPMGPRINPDTVPELTDKRELKDGITTYLVQDDQAGQAAMRKIINTHFGKDANPWCLLQGDGKGNLTKDSWQYWQHYSSLPKRVAFKDGKLLAFMATDKDVSHYTTHALEREIRNLDDAARKKLIQDFKAKHPNDDSYDAGVPSIKLVNFFRTWVSETRSQEWWDRADTSHAGIPYERTVPDNSSSGKTTETVELLPDGSERIVKRANTKTNPDGSKVTTTEKLDEKGNVDVNTRRTEYPDGSGETVETYGDTEETIWHGPTGGGSLDVVTIRGQIHSINAHDAHYGSISLQPYNNIIVWRNAGREEYISKSEPTTVAALAYIANAMSAVRRGDPIPPPAPDTTRYSIAQTTAGEKFVLLDRPNQIDWNDRDKVREYLTTLVGTGAVSLADSQRIEIGKELPKEWTRSSYAEKVFRNKRLTKVKAKTAQHLDELIVASGSRTSEPVRDKERENGVYYRRKVKFGVAGHDASRGYSGELVSYTENGEEILYDLVQINDDPSLTAELNRDGQGGYEILSPNHEGSTPRIIPQSGAPAQGGERHFVSVTPAEDAAYLDAVNRGDTETAQRMVREAAARAMPDTKIVDDSGDPLRAYHATDNDFTVFDKRRLGEFTDKNAVDEAAKQLARLGFWFNEKDLHRQIWAKKAVGTYLNITNPYETLLDELWSGLRGRKAESFISELKAQGYDGIVLEDSEFGGKSFVAFEPSQIKSADPVTYDDEGNVIPLSQRFNLENPDIRYSISIVKPWPKDFPNATLMTTRTALMAKHEDLFRKAKAGDGNAAMELVDALMSDKKRRDKVLQLKKDHPNAAVVCPVHAEESGGKNKIPAAFAAYIAQTLGMDVSGDIMQSVAAGHTGADAWYRLTHRAQFDGEVEEGKEYILVDDHITQGGTINELRSYIENNGGKVVAVAALTSSKGSSILSPRKETIDELKARYPDIDQLLRDADIAGSIDAITNSEAEYIRKFSEDEFRRRVADTVRNVSADEQGGTVGGSLRTEAVPPDAGRDRVAQAGSARLPEDGGRPLGESVAGEESPAEREQMRHSVFMGVRGAVNDKPILQRLYVAMGMAHAKTPGNILSGNTGKNRAWYTPKVRDEIYAKTGWWLGTDGQWRVEIPDMKPKALHALPDGDYNGELAHPVPLTDLVSNTRLFKAYSELKNITVWFVDPDSDSMDGISGMLEGDDIVMTWDDLTNLEPEDGEIKLTYEGMQTLTHEVQHYVQWLEGFATGGSQSVNGRRNYNILAGEVEARNAGRRYGGPYGTLVSARQDETTRRQMIQGRMAPWQTEDVPTLRQLISRGDGRQTDINGNPIARHSIARSTTAGIEADARRAISASIANGDKDAASNALENYVAYFKLAHGSIPKEKTLARIGLSLGMNTVNAKIILKNAERLAEQMKGSLIESASQNGDVATAMSLLKREKDISKKVENLIAGGVELGGKLTHKGVGQINSILQRRVESMMRSFTAATLADMEGDTGLDIAAEILANNPDAFDTEYRKAKKAAADEAETADEGGEDGNAAPYAPYVESEMSDSDRYKHDILLKEAAERVARFIEEAKARAAQNGAKAAEARERRRIVEVGGGADEGEDAGGTRTPPAYDMWDVRPKGVKADFKTPEEFAAFQRVWARDKFAKTHGLMTLGQVEQDRLFAEFYRICVRKELQDLADKLLAPKMLNNKGELVTNQRLAKIGSGARVWVNRRIADIEKGMRPDSIERASADIFAFINKAAIRVSRVDLITTFRQELKSRYLEGARFNEFKQDTERKLTGWLEESARYIMRVCSLSRKSVNGDPSELEREYNELHNIIDERARVYDESGHDVAEAAKEDAETRKAQWKLALLDKYGAMQSLMPGEILDLQNQAFDYLENEALKLEQSWQETREQQNRVRGDLSVAIVGPNGQRYQDKSMLTGRLFDALNGMIRLRLEHLTRFADADKKAKAKDAINSIMVMLGDGEVAYARALQADREAFFAGLGEIFKKADGKPDNAAIKKYLERMDEPVPEELSRQLSNQGFAGTMTFGQMLQLLVSLEQRSFKDTIEANGREEQAELIRSFRYRDKDGKAVNAFTKEDDAFVNMLRAFYAAKRDQLSEVTERMVGLKVDSPDPLYCPIRRFIDDRARSLHSDPTQRWDPISKIFSRRVPSVRDFDESRTIVGLFFENSKESAKLVAWAERGSFIRNVVTSVGFQSAVKRAFGPGELSKILKQLEATFNGGEQRSQTPGEVAAADKAVNFVTYAYLGFNPLSALKQTTSFAVWANQLPNGFGDLWRHMTHFDPKALKHLMESEEYRVRYGNAVGSGMDYATKGINMNPGQNPVLRALTGAGLWMLKRGDFMPGGWIAQGVYKDLLDKHMKEGMEFDAADRQAITETFNMLEETQQSGRTYNTNMLQLEHGRIGRLLTQFATSPLQQLQYETQAYREWRDMVRYNMGEDKIAAARAKFRRAVVINHVIIPAALNLVIAMYKAALGEEPPWERDGYHWTLLIDMLLGQFSRVFFLGAFAQTTLTALLKRETPRMGQMLPIEGAMGMAASGAFLIHDLATMNVDKVQKDLERAIKSTAPTRLPYNIFRRLTGDSDQDRKRRKESAKRK